MRGWGASGSEMMIQVDGDDGRLRGKRVTGSSRSQRRDGYAIGW